MRLMWTSGTKAMDAKRKRQMVISSSVRDHELQSNESTEKLF
jgi:hypothetical protein